jgi:hypothetical protein
MTTTRTQYRVAMSEIETYSIWIEATSETEAEQLAQQNWNETGFADWRFEDAQTSDLEVIDERELDQ